VRPAAADTDGRGITGPERSQLPSVDGRRCTARRRWPSRGFLHVEDDPLARFQVRQAVVLHRPEVDEDVLAFVDGDGPCLCSRLYHITVATIPTTIALLAGLLAARALGPEHQTTRMRLRRATGGAHFPLRRAALPG
jgi:hypothetical protein